MSVTHSTQFGQSLLHVASIKSLLSKIVQKDKPDYCLCKMKILLLVEGKSFPMIAIPYTGLITMTSVPFQIVVIMFLNNNDSKISSFSLDKSYTSNQFETSVF